MGRAGRVRAQVRRVALANITPILGVNRDVDTAAAVAG
jgi:hypothetical protein